MDDESYDTYDDGSYSHHDYQSDPCLDYQNDYEIDHDHHDGGGSHYDLPSHNEDFKGSYHHYDDDSHNYTLPSHNEGLIRASDDSHHDNDGHYNLNLPPRNEFSGSSYQEHDYKDDGAFRDVVNASYHRSGGETLRQDYWPNNDQISFAYHYVIRNITLKENKSGSISVKEKTESVSGEFINGNSSRPR